MTTDDTNIQGPQQASRPHPALARLAAFVGEWRWEAAVGGQPIGRGRTVFAWLEPGVLIQHSHAEQPEFPASTAIIGCDDALDTYCLYQYDSRGIARLYQMRLRDGVWEQWRDEPGFAQRFAGTFSDDGRRITGHWGKSADGQRWEEDFTLTYTKVGESQRDR
jgi:hypothetical protein